MKEKEKHSPRAQMTRLALFGPIVIVVACVEPHCTFRELIAPMQIIKYKKKHKENK